MGRQLGGYVRLMRYREFTWQVIVATLLGAAAGRGQLGWPLLGVLAANWMSMAFAFMINDVEDAPDDSLTPAKARRNPVSAGHLTAGRARAASFVVAVCAAVLYARLGGWPLAFGLAGLLLGQLYSWRRVRLKAVAVLDLVSHALTLGGLQMLAALFQFNPRPGTSWIAPLTAIMAISMYGQLHNEVRDREGDLRAGLKHTANLLGIQLSRGLMALFLTMGVGAILASILIYELVPRWALPLALGLAVVLSAIRLAYFWHKRRTVDLEHNLHKPFEMAGALSMVACFIWPWLAPRLGLLLRLQRALLHW